MNQKRYDGAERS